MRRVWRAWVALWDQREPPTALALVRIACAAVLLGDYLWIWHIDMIDALWSRYPSGYALRVHAWADASTLWTLAVAALACVLVGIGTRVACVVFVLVSAHQSHLAPDSESAIDALMRVVFVILALSSCNARWSVDAWFARRIGRPPAALVPAWPRYLLLVQLVWVYFSSGHNKASSAWGPQGGFTALANALLDPHNGRLPADIVAAIYPLTRVATALTIVFELTALIYPLLLYYAATADRPGRLRTLANRLRLRWIWLGVGVVFELGIAIGLKLGAFPFGMLALFPVLLLADDYRWNTSAPANRASLAS